jgi:hypothetical protein
MNEPKYCDQCCDAPGLPGERLQIRLCPTHASAEELRKALAALLNLWKQEARLNRAARMCRGDGRHARPGYDCPACDAAALLDK